MAASNGSVVQPQDQLGRAETRAVAEKRAASSRVLAEEREQPSNHDGVLALHLLDVSARASLPQSRCNARFGGFMSQAQLACRPS